MSSIKDLCQENRSDLKAITINGAIHVESESEREKKREERKRKKSRWGAPIKPEACQTSSRIVLGPEDAQRPKAITHNPR